MNQKQARFCEEYVVDLSATKAAIRAGYSPRSAYAIGAALLKKHEIASRVRGLQDARSAATKVTAERVLTELALVGFSRIDDYSVDEDGKVEVTGAQASPEAIRAVGKVKRRRITAGDAVIVEVELSLWCKLAALDKIGRHLCMFKERVEITDNRGLADKVAAARKRVRDNQ